MSSNFDDVYDFHEKFNQLRSRTPRRLAVRKLVERVEFMHEELEEFIAACEESDDEKMFDALIDLVYVAMGTAVMLGYPWQAGWDEVQRANMAKEIGPTHRGHSSDVRKPEGWKPPNLTAVLFEARFDRRRFDDVDLSGGELAPELRRENKNDLLREDR